MTLNDGNHRMPTLTASLPTATPLPLLFKRTVSISSSQKKTKPNPPHHRYCTALRSDDAQYRDFFPRSAISQAVANFRFGSYARPEERADRTDQSFGTHRRFWTGFSVPPSDFRYGRVITDTPGVISLPRGWDPRNMLDIA